MSRAQAVDAKHHGVGTASVHRGVGIDFDVLNHRQESRCFENRSSGQIDGVVAITVVASLVGRNAEFVDRGPLADAVALVGADTPVDPFITLGMIADRVGVVEEVNCILAVDGTMEFAMR